MDLTSFLIPPESYKQTTASLEAAFPKGEYRTSPYFSWLSKDKSRAIFKRKPSSQFEISLTILDGELPIDEMIVDFKDGKFLGCTISVFNRGDSGTMTTGEFLNRKKMIESALTDILKVQPRKREGNIIKGILTSGLTWRSARGMAVIEHNMEAPRHVEFIRLRLAHYNAQGLYKAALKDKTISSVKKYQIQKNVIKKGNDIHIENIPMVDQGSKGYCVVASVQRLFEYYQISCDMHQLAQISGSDPSLGTNTVTAAAQIGKIDQYFKTRYSTIAVKKNSFSDKFYEVDGQYLGDSISKKETIKKITSMIDKGIPVLWALEIGKYKETPPLSEQTSGGHMRLITGYNLKDNLIYFSDSWGAGHEHKHMNLDEAFSTSYGFYTLTPTIN